MLKVTAENNMQRSILRVFDTEKMAWEMFKNVNAQVPVLTGRLKASTTLVAGTNMLLRGGLPKHFVSLLSRYVVAIVYSAPKPVGKKAREFYLASGRWFDYAYKVERNKSYLIENIKRNLAKIMKRSIRPRA